MEITEYGLYNIKDEYFEDFENDILMNNKHENRPYYCTIKDNTVFIAKRK